VRPQGDSKIHDARPGEEVARQERRERTDRRPCLVALTDYRQHSDRTAAFDAAFDHHLTEPVQFADSSRLLASVARSNLGEKSGA
jgi:CheY-like chemotaxis protein